MEQSGRLQWVAYVEEVEPADFGVGRMQDTNTMLAQQGRQVRVGHEVAADRRLLTGAANCFANSGLGLDSAGNPPFVTAAVH